MKIRRSNLTDPVFSIVEGDKENQLIKNPLSLQQLCYMQLMMDPVVKKYNYLPNDVANKIAEVLFDEKAFPDASGDFFKKLLFIIESMLKNKMEV